MGLLLRAVDAAGPLRWRWLLTDTATGTALADHEVDLAGPPDEAARFANLHGHVSWYASPDRRIADGARLVAEAGAWAGRVLLGEHVTAAIAAAAEAGPVTVTVSAAPPADAVLLWPLELAHATGPGGDGPLAARGDVTFVYRLNGGGQPPDSPPGYATGAPVTGALVTGALAGQKAPVAGALRILAVFSQPATADVLALRKERYELSRLVRTLAARHRAAIELRVVQYGTTRGRLREIADDGDGWDIVHLSGHGGGGAFLLEKPDGSPDPVPAAALVALLRPARRRVKLAIVSACESAADTTAQTYRLLGLTDQAEALEAGSETANAPAGSSASAAANPDGAPAGAAANPDGGPAGSAAEPPADGPVDPPARPDASIPGLARVLIRDLGCPVVAMRYPVADEFAIAYTSVLYDQLLAHRKPLGQAVAYALAEATAQGPSPARPPLSIATPGLFTAPTANETDDANAAATGTALRLLAPAAPPDLDAFSDPKMAFFEPPYGPGEPARFVGRAAAMARASTALAPGSGRAAVLLHGMAGSGKTTCAMELAYRHQDAFAALAFWQAPTRDDEWQAALGHLATRLETQLGRYGFRMTGHIGTQAALEAYLPVLRQALRTAGVLLVLDNLETLLTPAGTWRDPRWQLLIEALTSHDGESRAIMTSRTVPAGFTDAGGRARPGSPPAPPGSARDAVVVLPVHALSLGESVALARELPHLGALLHSDVGPVRDDNGTLGTVPRPGAEQLDAERIAADRELVRRVLRIVQGHPKLMELADAAAADRGRLTEQLIAAETTAADIVDETETGTEGNGTPGTGGLAAFFLSGESTLDPDAFLAALSAWTTTALGALPPDTRLMAEFLTCLEDDDRASDVIGATWPELWRRLGRPGDPPEPAPLLLALAVAALTEAEAPSAPARNGDQTPVTYRIHPGVAAAIVGAAPADVRAAVDAELAAFWYEVFDGARQREEGEHGSLVVLAGLAAAPYLLRQEDWNTASILLEEATLRDMSPGMVQAVLPSLRRIAAATGAADDAGVLARVLRRVDPAEAERLLRTAQEAAAEAGDYRVASASAGQLFSLLRDAGRLGEALAVAEQVPELTRRAGLGPWTRLGDQGRRLQVLGLMGEHARVLAEVDRLRQAMAALPGRRGPDEAVNPWNVRETILGTGHSSALATGEWARCLELNAEILASIRGRGAGEHEVTRFRFNDAGPLIRLGRRAEAGRLLADCQRVFQEYADTAMLAKVLSGRANLENSVGRSAAAADLERAALRLSYVRPEPRDIAIGHYNLANYLGRLGSDRAGQRAHRLAAALIFRLAGMAHDLSTTVRAVAAELREDGGADPSLPSTVAQVTEVAEQTEGVRLGAVLAALQPDQAAIEAALAEILRTATVETAAEVGAPAKPSPPAPPTS